MPRKVVETKFKAIDGTSKILNRMSVGSKKFGDTTSRSMKKATTSALSFKKVVGGILTASIITRGMSELKRGVRGVTEEFIEFEHAITAAAAKLDVKRGTKQFEELNKAARKIGATTEFTATQAGKAIDALARSGFNQQQAMKAAAQSTHLATIADMELADSTKIAVAGLNIFGLKTDDLAQNEKNLTRIQDVLARTVVSSATDLESLFETMKFGASNIKIAGGNLETFAAIAGLATKGGLEGSMAATAISAAMRGIATPTAKAIKGLRKLKVDAVDPITKEFKDPIQVLGELSKALEKLSGPKQARILKDIFEIRGVRLKPLIDLGSKAILDYKKKLESTGRTAKEIADEMRQSIQNRLAVLKSTAIELGFKFIEVFEDKIPGAIDAVVKALRELDVGAIIADIKNLALFVKDLATNLEKVTPALYAVAAVWATLKIGAAITAIAAVTKGIVALGVAAGGAGPLLAVLLGPIGAIALAVGGVTAAVIVLNNNWDDLVITMGWAVDDLKDRFDEIRKHSLFTKTASMVHPLLTIPAAIIKHWEPIRDFFKELWLDIKNISGKIFNIADEITAPFRFHTIGKGTGAERIGTHSELQRERISKKSIAGKFGGFAKVTPPNLAEEQARRTPLLEGKITLAGAPKGTEFKAKTRNAPPVKTEVLGVNP